VVCQSGGIRTAIRSRGTVAEDLVTKLSPNKHEMLVFERVITQMHLINSQVGSVIKVM
jgi:hypothetical protein